MGTSVTYPVRTPTPWRGWSTWDIPGNPWSPLLLLLPTTSACPLRMGIHLLWPVSHITLAGPLFRGIFFHSSYPLLDIACSSRGLYDLCHSAGMSWAPGFVPLLYNSLHNGTVTLCTVLTVTSAWAALLAQLFRPIKQNPTSLAPSKGSPSLHDCHPKNRIASPGASTIASVICSSRPSLQHVHY